MMSNPFQTQRRSAVSKTAQARGPLTDTSPDARLLQPRSKKLLHAVKMLDVLTSGDEGLYDYLSAKAGEAKIKPAFDPFAAKRGMAQPAAEEDSIDAMIQEPPPPADTQEFQELKEELYEQCQEIVQEESITEEENVTLLAPCGLYNHRIHMLDDKGDILRHYRPNDLDTPLLRKADELLHQGFVLVEVRGDFPDAAPGTVLYAVSETGAVRKVTV